MPPPPAVSECSPVSVGAWVHCHGMAFPGEPAVSLCGGPEEAPGDLWSHRCCYIPGFVSQTGLLSRLARGCPGGGAPSGGRLAGGSLGSVLLSIWAGDGTPSKKLERRVLFV